MAQDKYNGWTNKETWIVDLWLNNDQSIYDSITRQAKLVYQDAEADRFVSISKREQAIYDMAKWLQDNVYNNAPFLSHGMYDDLLSYTLANINYREIASHFIDSAIYTLENY